MTGSGATRARTRRSARTEYIANEVAAKYGASPKETTQDGNVAHAEVPEVKPTRYRDGWLPS